MPKNGPVANPHSRRTDLRGGTKPLVGGAHDAPELVGDYLPQTLDWYRTWVESEQASQFTGTDWQRLRMLAPLVDAYFENPTKDLMAEIRQNESKLGATAEDRQRLRWKLSEPEPEQEQNEKPKSRERKDPRAK